MFDSVAKSALELASVEAFFEFHPAFHHDDSFCETDSDFFAYVSRYKIRILWLNIRLSRHKNRSIKSIKIFHFNQSFKIENIKTRLEHIPL